MMILIHHDKNKSLAIGDWAIPETLLCTRKPEAACVQSFFLCMYVLHPILEFVQFWNWTTTKPIPIQKLWGLQPSKSGMYPELEFVSENTL